MRLRNVSTDDVDAYVRMRCDPVMMADLGGPQSREEMAAKVRRDAEQAAADLAWLKMIVPDPATPEVVAGTVTLWSHDTDNAASNGICRSVGFRFVSVTDMPFAGQIFRTNHWSMDPRTDLT
ncbi:N-acetyltransferase [Streptomyces sp. NPDC014846]|uniref:N-acetyltransferase n=1 Tax=unclassified Streptomyces TaxID=2593676 RepID=UPI0036F9D28B